MVPVEATAMDFLVAEEVGPLQLVLSLLRLSLCV